MTLNASLKKLRPQELMFGRKLQDFCNLLGRYGIAATPLSDTGVQKFTSLSFIHRDLIIENFTFYADLIFSAEKNGVDLKDEEALVRFALPRLGLTASQGTMDKIKDGNVIEIYNAQNIQIFRNITFMEFCSYSLLDLITFEFYELYERSTHITAKLLDAGREVLGTAIDFLDFAEKNVPQHTLREKFSDARDQYLVTMKYLCPLYSGPNKRSALLVVQQGERLPKYDQAALAFI